MLISFSARQIKGFRGFLQASFRVGLTGDYQPFADKLPVNQPECISHVWFINLFHFIKFLAPAAAVFISAGMAYPGEKARRRRQTPCFGAGKREIYHYSFLRGLDAL